MNEAAFDVVCFGEVLWDMLPGGATPGGAPVNVAYHLARQGCRSTVITSIGNDDAGKQLQQIFAGRGVDTSYFQVDDQHETGKVYGVQDEHRDMTYDIVKPVAWDFIEEAPEHKMLVSQSPVFIFGSLAARNEGSAKTLFSLLDIAQKKVFDVNLRPPHFTESLIKTLLPGADVLKMNEEELELVASWLSAYKSTEDNIRMLAEKYNIPEIVVTRGSRGAVLYSEGNFFYHAGYKVKVADTVGSGDAFLAGLVSARMQGLPHADALERASRLGAYIATQHGACPNYGHEWLSTNDWLVANTPLQ